MKKYFLALLALVNTAIFAQNTEQRNVGDFNSINVATPVKVEITQGENNSVSVTGEADDIRKIETTVKDGVLSVLGNGNDEITVHITVKNLQGIEMSGATEISSTNTITTDSLMIVGTGASEAKLTVQTKKINTTLSGASELRLTGNSDVLNAQLSGASELKAYQLMANNVKVETTGASNAHVHANNDLNASSSGASSIRYEGLAASKTLNATGSSSISMRGDDNSSDTTNLHIGPYDLNITPNGDDRSHRERHKSNHDFEFWEGMDLGVNGYLTQDNQIELPASMKWMELNYAKSYVFGWNIIQKNIHVYKNYVNIGTGLGLTWYHYNFRNDVTPFTNVDFQTASFDSMHYNRNRLNMCYVNAPLFLEFNTNNNDAHNSFHFGAGVQFGYNVFDNKLKQRYEMNGQEFKNKVKDDFNVNPFRYDIIARIGYGKFTIFGSYGLSTLFEKGKGPTVYPISAGIHISM